MKKFLIIALLMLTPLIQAAPDVYDQLRGRQMVGDAGAPWFADDAIMYFGTGKDTSLTYNSTSGYLEMVGLTAYDNTSITVTSGEDITFAGGDSKADFSAGSGVTKTTLGAVTIGPGAVGITGTATFSKTVNYAVNASTTVSTTLTSSSTKTVYGIDAHAANVTLTLPDAATVSGRTYVIGTNYDPGSYYVKITSTGSDKLGGTGGFTIAQTTDGKAGMTLTSDGTLYILSGAYGTWAEGTA